MNRLQTTFSWTLLVSIAGFFATWIVGALGLVAAWGFFIGSFICMGASLVGLILTVGSKEEAVKPKRASRWKLAPFISVVLAVMYSLFISAYFELASLQITATGTGRVAVAYEITNYGSVWAWVEAAVLVYAFVGGLVLMLQQLFDRWNETNEPQADRVVVVEQRLDRLAHATLRLGQRIRKR